MVSDDTYTPENILSVVRKKKKRDWREKERGRGKEGEEESTTLSDGINWRPSPSKRLPGVHCTLHRTKKGDIYLPIPRMHFRRRNKSRRHDRHPSQTKCILFFTNSPIYVRDYHFLSSRHLSRFSLLLSYAFCFSDFLSCSVLVVSKFAFPFPFTHFFISLSFFSFGDC